MYEIGKVYVWQNLVEYAYLNGTDTTVTSGPILALDVDSGQFLRGQRTDTTVDGITFAAQAGDLRPKNPPPGEQLIRDLFIEPVTA